MNTIETIGDYSLRGQIFNKLRDNILKGEYKEGELLQEIKISELFGVSRTPVREALKQLELEGLVTMLPNKGVKVSAISDDDIRDIYDIRCLIEGLAARWAAEKITDKQLEQMKKILDLAEFYTLKNDITSIAEQDSKFHKALYDACSSKYLQHILTDFHQYSQLARLKAFSNQDRAKHAFEEHKAIYEALKLRDCEKAETYANIHVKNAKFNLLNSISITK